MAGLGLKLGSCEAEAEQTSVSPAAHVQLVRGQSYSLTESLATRHNVLPVPRLGHPAVEISQLDLLTAEHNPRRSTRPSCYYCQTAKAALPGPQHVQI
jgi:hypothetical protein